MQGSIQTARYKTMEFPVEFPWRQNRGISRGIFTESPTVTKPWNFYRKFHGCVSVELSVEIPLKFSRF